MTSEEIIKTLNDADPVHCERLFAAARERKRLLGKDEVLLRGLIETSNQCHKNCSYCGLRSSHINLARYHMDEDEVIKLSEIAIERGYPAIALQAGELESEENTAFYERILKRLDSRLEVTLSLGEQDESVYRRWLAAAGKNRVVRYLLRIESSNRNIYERIHPASHSFDRRLECIRTLKRLGFVTGSGVMIGIPGQTTADLARDIEFFKSEHLDMIGMGPYIPGGDLNLALRMIAVTRLELGAVNIVAATALEALGGVEGRNLGIEAGANVIMPSLTPEKYRKLYDIYPGKTDCRA